MLCTGGQMKLRILFSAALVYFCGVFSLSAAGPAGSEWSLSASPTYFHPFLNGSFQSNEVLAPSWGVTLSGEYALPVSLPLDLRLGLGYSSAGLLPAETIPVDGAVREITLSAGAGLSRNLSPGMTLLGFLDTGIVFGSLDSGDMVPYASLKAGAGLTLYLTETLSARVETAALYKSGLAGGLSAGLGMSYRLPSSGAAGRGLPGTLVFPSFSVSDIFPSLRSQYEEKPVGTLSVTNTGRKALNGLSFRFIIRQYMDAPRDCLTIDSLAPGETVQVPLYALFNDSILGVTEATRVSGQVLVEYAGREDSRSVTVQVYDRSALTWKDDRVAAAFVSSKDPWVQDLTGNIMASVMNERNPELTRNLQTAMAIHEGLKVYGISYMLSPNRPFARAAA